MFGLKKNTVIAFVGIVLLSVLIVAAQQAPAGQGQGDAGDKAHADSVEEAEPRLRRLQARLVLL